MAQQRETLFKNKVVRQLRTLPNTWFTKIQQTTIGGTPDFLACIHGFFVAIELKTDSGNLSKMQEFNLAQIKNAKGISIVTCPSIWHITFEYLKDISGGK